jgi:multiple sugar transport system permease protein
MATLSTKKTPSYAADLYKGERRLAYLMIAPALFLLFTFLFVPFLMAFGLSLTNTRLISPNPPEFIQLDNYRELLGIQLIVMEPEIDSATGQPRRTEDGALVYPRARTILRGSPQYEGLQELDQIIINGTRYLIAAGDPQFWRALRNNFLFTIIVVPLQTAFALLLAMLVNQKLPGRNLFRTVYFSPVVTTMAVISVLWFFMYNPQGGLINSIIRVFGLGPFNWLNDPASALFSIILLSIWQGAGFQMVIFLAGLQEIPEELYEASQIDGANAWQQFTRITLPSLRNTTIFVVISTTILAFKLFVQVDVMTFGVGGPEDSTLTAVLHLVNQGFRQQRVGYAAALSVVFVLLVLAISVLQRVAFRNREA